MHKNTTYYTLVESYRDADGKVKQRTIKYLGDINKAFEIILNDDDMSKNIMLVESIKKEKMGLYSDELLGEVEGVKTAIKWVGAKSRPNKLTQYLELIPKHDVFVSPFCGGCSVELYKQHSKVEIMNDFNGNLTNLLCVIKNRGKELAEALDSLPVSEVLFDKYVESMDVGNEFECAVKYLYVCRLGFNGGGGKSDNFSIPSIQSRNNPTRAYHKAIKLIERMQKRMKHWVILNRDFEYVIERFNSEDTFFFIDSPYRDYYKSKFKNDDHYRLAELLKRTKGKFMYCHDGREDYITELYKDFNRVEYKAHLYCKNKDIGEECEMGTEIIFYNY